jgi:hypothetical protein
MVRLVCGAWIDVFDPATVVTLNFDAFATRPFWMRFAGIILREPLPLAIAIAEKPFAVL